MTRFTSGSLRSAMTLIEVMISLILSLTILLVLAATYRVISQGIALVTAWSNENSLLRTGFLLALKDADCWHSNADADPPYEKDFLREEPVPIVGADPGCQSRSRRPFRPIRFSKSLDPNPPDANSPEKNPAGFGVENLVFYDTPRVAGTTELLLNPNAFLPHDPRSWYRNNLFPNQIGTCAGGIPRLAHGDYALMAAIDMAPTHVDAWNQRFAGDLPAYKDQSPYTKADRLRDHQALPRMGWEIFQYLHYRGLPEYLRNGTPWVIMDPQGLLPNGSATTPTIPAAPTTRRDHDPNDPMLGWHSPVEYGWIWRTGWLDWKATDGAADWMTMLGTDLALGGKANAMVESAFPGYFRDSQSGDEMTYDGVTQGYFKSRGAVRPIHSYSADENGGAQKQITHATDYSSSTVRFPYNLSDANRPAYRSSLAANPDWFGSWFPLQASLDFSNKPSQASSMSTHIQRLHEVLGSELVIHRVRVQPVKGNVIELIFTHATTTWRGARQHWRLQHASDPTQKPIGDYYE